MIKSTLMKSIMTLAGASALAFAAATATAHGHDGHKKGQDGHKEHMTQAEPGEIGSAAPAFTLMDTEGNEVSLSDFEGKVVVLEWFNPQCPFVVKHHKKFDTMTATQKWAKEQDVVWLAINSGAPGKQGHGVELNSKMKDEWNISYPILMDESGEIGRAYGAKTTPHMFIIAEDGTIAYNGAIDSDRSISKAGEINFVEAALKAHLAGETIETASTRPYGCSVKYGKAG
ncbi:MAG: thioredoxin family protein [Planctomycetota bacterium]